MNSTEERLEIQDKNIQRLTSDKLMLQLKYKGLQDREMIEGRLKEAEERRKEANTIADEFKWDGAIIALKWVLSAKSEEDIQTQRESHYGKEVNIIGAKKR